MLPYGVALSKDIKLTVALGIDAVAPVDAKLEKLFEMKKSKDDNIIDGVEKNEHIATYTREKAGKNARACNGKYIVVRSPKKIDKQPLVDESVSQKDLGDKIEYYANESGYVLYSNNKLSISQTLKLAKADFKSSANINDEKDDKDISVHIAHQSSESEDAIGSGVKIDVKELNVDGAVGSNVKINAQNLNVDAQTHKNAKMEVSESANVKLHRGELVANDAEIDMLETGKITAHRSIHIKKMLGGEAIAPIVIVDELLSNCNITASQKIEIHSIGGENNKLIINPDAIESYHEDIVSIKQEIKSLSKELFEIHKDFDKRYKEHTDQIDRIKTFQERIVKAKRAGKTPMKQDSIRIKMFQADAQKFKEEKESIDEKEQQLSELKSKLNKYYEKEMHAKIISHSAYDGHTKVAFIDLATKEEIAQHPKGNIETISLTYGSDGKKVIKLD
jgi:hypothetical protein